MTAALVGSAGTLATAAAATVNPSYGQATSAGNLLAAVVTAESAGTNSNTIATTSTGWSIGPSVTSAGTPSSAVCVAYKPNCGAGEATPTFTCTGASYMTAVLSEWSGLDTSASPIDNSGTGTGSSNIANSNPGNDVAVGELFIGGTGIVNSKTATFTFTDSFSPGGTQKISVSDGATKQINHAYAVAYITNANSAFDADTVTVTPSTGVISSHCQAAASFKLASTAVATFVGNPTALRRVQRIALQPERARHDQPVPPQAAANTNQPVKVWQAQARRKLGFPKRGRVAAPPWPQAAANTNQPTIVSGVRAGRRFGVPRRGRTVTAFPQATIPVASIIPDAGQARAFRGWRLGRPKATQPTAEQGSPVPTNRQTPRRTWAAPRGRHRAIPQGQATPPTGTQSRRRFTMARRGRNVVPVPAQVNPPYPITVTVQRRALRGWFARKGRRAETVPAQSTPANPAFVAGRPQRRILRGWMVRHGRQFLPTPPQAAANTNQPVKVWQAQARRKFGVGRRGKVNTPVPPQAAANTNQPTIVPAGTRRVLRGWLTRRSHPTVPAADTSVPASRRAARATSPRRARSTFVPHVPGQAQAPTQPRRRPTVPRRITTAIRRSGPLQILAPIIAVVLRSSSSTPTTTGADSTSPLSGQDSSDPLRSADSTNRLTGRDD